MDSYIKTVTLDVDAVNNFNIITAKQGDKVNRKLTIRLRKEGVEFAPSGVSTIQFRCQKPDGNAVILDNSNGDVTAGANGLYTVTLSEQCLIVDGRALCDIAFLDASGNTLSSASFYMDIIPMPDLTSGEDSVTQWLRLQEAIDTAEHFYEGVAFRTSGDYIQYTVDGGTTWANMLPISAIDQSLLNEIYDTYVTQEISNAEIASFSDGANDIPVKSLVVGIEPVQGGSGDPSPTNVRPITGWTSCNVVRTGKNFRVANTSGSGTSRTIEFTYNSDGTYSVSGGTTTGVVLADSNRVNMAVTLPAGTYTVSCNNDHDLYLWVYNNTTKSALCVARDGYKTFTFTLTEEAEIATTLTASSGAEVSDGTNYIQIEVGSTATAFESYQGITYSIAFPTEAGTVYNGILDVTNGVLTVTSIGINLNNVSWTLTTYANVFRTTGATGKKAGYSNLRCSNYKTTNSALTAMQNYTIRGHATDAASIYIKDERYETVNDFVAALENCYLVYEIAQPITYTLTPTEIKTLLGLNNILADTGEVQNVIYRADTALYIDKILNPA